MGTKRGWPLVLTAIGLVCASSTNTSRAASSPTRFEIAFPEAVHGAPITGRVIVVIARANATEPRLQVAAGSTAAFGATPLFGADIDGLRPGMVAAIDNSTLGYPMKSLSEIPAGDYYVQALVNLYTQFRRTDGHTIWAHNDQWEGQQWNTSPGNLYSAVQHVHIDPAKGYTVKLDADHVIPPIAVSADTEWVKHVKIQSRLLTAFWGQPMYLGATLLLPKGYADPANATLTYPAIYVQNHFSLVPAFGFTTGDTPETEAQRRVRESNGIERGYEFAKAWTGDNFPRVIAITFQHPTPYFDDSYAVNSVNNGPYGDALLTELVPYLEQQFRITPKPYARVLTGGSTGGWESLALQVYHPDFFNGTWTFYPDPIDFRRYQMTDIYNDDNAFYPPHHESDGFVPERFMWRDADGQPEITTRQHSQLEAVLGSHGRSGQQFEIWEATYGPIGTDGYPRPLWNKLTGKIDHEVAAYMREHGFDLREYTERNWPKVGSSLVGKIHVYCGDMDYFYLNLATYLFEDFMNVATAPAPQATIVYGRPMKGHGWHGMTNAALVRAMAEHIGKSAAGTEHAGF